MIITEKNLKPINRDQMDLQIKNKEILKVLKAAKLEEKDVILTDSGSCYLDVFIRGSGRPLSEHFRSIIQVEAVRFKADWFATGQMKEKTRNYNASFSLSLTEQTNTLVLTIMHRRFTIPSDSPAITVINSAPTGELLVQFLQGIPMDTYPQTTLSANGFIVLKDNG